MNLIWSLYVCDNFHLNVKSTATFWILQVSRLGTVREAENCYLRNIYLVLCYFLNTLNTIQSGRRMLWVSRCYEHTTGKSLAVIFRCSWKELSRRALSFTWLVYANIEWSDTKTWCLYHALLHEQTCQNWMWILEQFVVVELVRIWFFFFLLNRKGLLILVAVELMLHILKIIVYKQCELCFFFLPHFYCCGSALGKCSKRSSASDIRCWVDMCEFLATLGKILRWGSFLACYC